MGIEKFKLAHIGATVDAEARTAINTWLARARASTGRGLIAG